MTSRERVLTSLAHREPDHVPCWLGTSPEWKELAREYLGLPDDESLLVHLGDDFRRVHSSYAGPQATHPTANLSHPDATYRTPFGIERHGYGYGMPLDDAAEGRQDRRRGARLSLARSRVDGCLAHPGRCAEVRPPVRRSWAASGRPSGTTPSTCWTSTG